MAQLRRHPKLPEPLRTSRGFVFMLKILCCVIVAVVPIMYLSGVLASDTYALYELITEPLTALVWVYSILVVITERRRFRKRGRLHTLSLEFTDFTLFSYFLHVQGDGSYPSFGFLPLQLTVCGSGPPTSCLSWMSVTTSLSSSALDSALSYSSFSLATSSGPLISPSFAKSKPSMTSTLKLHTVRRR